MPAWYVHLVDGATSSTCRRINCAARVGSAVQGVGSGSCKSECLHGETREVVSNLVLGARYMRDANVEIV